MAYLIESLVNAPVKRQDEARLSLTKRPAPNRMRQLLELFMAMGPSASFQTLMRSIDLKALDPQSVIFMVLGRWPTPKEVREVERPYKAWPHLQSLLRSPEFRQRISRAACDAFPERRRLLYVRIPSSGGRRVYGTINSKHPILPADLTDKRFNNPTVLAQALGTVFGRMNVSNALAIVQPTLSVFVDPPQPARPAADPLDWHIPIVPCRTGDLLFTVIREPAERALAYVNGELSAIKAGETAIPDPVMRNLDMSVQDPANLSAADLRQIGGALLRHTLHKNPICQALGDGTADGTLEACLCAPVNLVPIEKFTIWGRTAFDLIPPEGPTPPETILRPEDLTPADRDILAEATAQDRIIYDRFKTRLASGGIPSVTGWDL